MNYSTDQAFRVALQILIKNDSFRIKSFSDANRIFAEQYRQLELIDPDFHVEEIDHGEVMNGVFRLIRRAARHLPEAKRLYIDMLLRDHEN